MSSSKCMPMNAHVDANLAIGFKVGDFILEHDISAIVDMKKVVD